MPGKVMLKPDYAVLLRTELRPSRSQECDLIPARELFADDVWMFLHTLLFSTFEGGEGATDAPWEISLPYVERTFVFAHSRWPDVPSYDDMTCPNYAKSVYPVTLSEDFIFEAYD